MTIIMGEFLTSERSEEEYTPGKNPLHFKVNEFNEGEGKKSDVEMEIKDPGVETPLEIYGRSLDGKSLTVEQTGILIETIFNFSANIQIEYELLNMSFDENGNNFIIFHFGY